jgi:hypothetical protein
MFKGFSTFDGLNIMTDCLGRGFERLGWELRVVDLRQENAYINTLDILLEGDVLLIVGMNAMGRAIIAAEDGGSMVDPTGGFYRHLSIPILDFVSDHPVYIHDRLKVPLNNHRVAVVTANNVPMVQRWINNDVPVRHVPHGSNIPAEGTVQPWSARDIDVFASISLNDHPDVLRASWSERLDRTTAALLNAVVEEQEPAPDTPLDETVVRVFGSAIRTVEDLKPHFIEVDRYLRAQVKLRTAQGIARAGLPLTIMGPGWPDLGGRVTFLPPAPGTETLPLMGRSRVVVNPLPPYYSCLERPLQAALHGAAAASTSSEWLTGAMEEANIALSMDPDDAAATIADALADSGLADRAARGRDVVARAHTWDHRAAELLHFAFGE